MGAVGAALVSGVTGLFAQGRAENRQDSEIQRRVEDGRKAGLSPLASIGASTAGPTPTGGIETAGSALADYITGRVNKDHEEEKRKLENDLLRAQIKQSNAGAEADLINARSRTLLAAAAHPTRGVAPAADVSIGGFRLKPTPGFDDASAIQKRYDSLVSNLAGVGNLAADTYHTYMPSSADLYRWWEGTAAPARHVRVMTGIDRTPRKYRGTSKM